MSTEPAKAAPKVATKDKRPSSVIVLNNCERIIISQFRGTAALNPRRLIFHPGANVVGAEDIAELRAENVHFDEHFTERIKAIRALEGPGPERVGQPRFEIIAENVDPQNPLAKLDNKTAARVIKETFDVGVLGRWLRLTDDAEVRTAIRNQVTFLKTGEQPEEID